jgi:SM-20-related protein
MNGRNIGAVENKMPRSNLDELRALGLFLAPEFFAAELCHELRLTIEKVPAQPASIFVDGVVTADPGVRRADCYDLAAGPLRVNVCSRLDAILPAVAKHYEVPLTGYEAPQIVRYSTGGFFRPHVDNAPSSDGPAELRRRKVSCVAFLNSSTNSSEGFVGGALAFFRLAEQPSCDNSKTFLYPVTGLLVAFRSDVYHEVLPVMANERFALVTWFR